MRIAVVGGGLGGLTAARALLAAGIDAHVFEAGARAGGVVGTSNVDGFVREHAASSFLGGTSRGAYAVCQQLGVEVEHASPRAKRRWIYIDGKLRALPRSPLHLVTTDLLTWRGKLDVLREPFRPAHPTNGVDESIHAFAARRLGAEAARAIVAPFVTGIYAADAHEISLEAGFPKLAALEAKGGLVRGMLRDAARTIPSRVLGLAAGKRPRPRPPRGLFAPKGGLGALVEALAKELGPAIRLGAPVAEVAHDVKGVRIDGELFDGAVLAIPAQDAAAVVTISELANRLAVFRRAPTAVVYLGYREDDVPGARDGFGALVAQGEDARVLGVVFESTVWSERAPAGHAMLRCIFGGGRDPDVLELDDAQLIARATRDVQHVLGATAAPAHASVIRWQRGVAQYGLGHRDRVREAVTAARTHKIVLAGADYRGPGVNDLCADADLVVDEVRVVRWLAVALLAACSSKKPRVADDATHVPRPTDAVTDAAPDAGRVSTETTGDLQIRVAWKEVPIPMRASPGRTACRTPRAPVVAPTATWGIPDVLVVIAGATLPEHAGRVVLQDCALAPRVVAAKTAVLESAADRPAQVTFAKRGTLAELAKLEAGAPQTILLPVAGHAVALPLEDGGVYELAADGETAWVVASASAGVTEPNGQLLVKDLAPGKYDVTAWLPPRAGGKAQLVTGSVTVVAGDLADLTLELE